MPGLNKPKVSSVFLVSSAAASSFVRSIFRFKNLFRADRACCAAFTSGCVPRVSTRSENPLNPLSLPSPIDKPATPKICPTMIFAPRFRASFNVSGSEAAQ